MKLKGVLLLLLLGLAAQVFAGKIYGSITEGGKPVAQGVKVEVSCATNNYTAQTDDMGRQINTSSAAEKAEYMGRLNQIAREITTRQLVLLEQVGAKFGRTVDFEKFRATPGGLELEPAKLVLDNTEREFMLSVLDYNPERRELRMELGVRTPQESANMQMRTFHVGYYDFPMIDNTRLSGDQRVAVVLNQMNEDGADLTIVYFPGSYASLREKVSYDEVVERLRLMGQPSQ
jgi:hypothetical protein